MTPLTLNSENTSRHHDREMLASWRSLGIRSQPELKPRHLFIPRKLCKQVAATGCPSVFLFPPVWAQQYQSSPRELQIWRSHKQMASLRLWCMMTGGKDPWNPAECSWIIMTMGFLCSRVCLRACTVATGEKRKPGVLNRWRNKPGAMGIGELSIWPSSWLVEN